MLIGTGFGVIEYDKRAHLRGGILPGLPYEVEADTRMIEQLDAKLQYEEIREMMNNENPLITQVFEMKERDGLSNEEIASELGITKRQTYYLYSKALAIGQKYNRS